MRRTSYESATAPTSHSAADPAEFNVRCRSKSNLPNRTDSDAALLLYLTHQLGSVHEWNSIWNGPNSQRCSDTQEELMVDASTFLYSCLEERCVKDFPPSTVPFGSWKTQMCLRE